MNLDHPKVAIVHDVLDRYGGAERVMEGLLKIWPQADLYVSRYTPRPETDSLTRDRTVHHSFMQKLPFWPQLAKFYTPLYPFAFEAFDLSAYDLVFSSTAHFAKAVLTNTDQLHVCYCHTPPRFLYGYPSETKIRQDRIGRILTAPLDHMLRQYDFLAAQRPDVILTNSQTTAARIKKFYRREAEIVYPPIEMERFNKPSNHLTIQPSDSYFLVVSRLVAYKNVDVVVEAFREISDRLIIVGTGPEEEKLRKIAGNNVEFKGFVPDDELTELYRGARAVIFSAADEDFGIVPVEAMAAGTPVIALQSGGVTETVIEDQTGIFYPDNTVESVRAAIEQFKSRESQFNTEEIAKHAARFNQASFERRIKEILARFQTIPPESNPINASPN